MHAVGKEQRQDQNNATEIKSPVSKALIVGAVDRRVDDLVPVDGAFNATVLKNTNRIDSRSNKRKMFLL